MRITKSSVEAQWFTFEGEVQFQIRPFKFTSMNLESITESMYLQFDYCIVDWKGIDDEKDKPLKCNEENKKHLYDYYQDVRDFVFDKQEELKKRFDIEIKNS